MYYDLQALTRQTVCVGEFVLVFPGRVLDKGVSFVHTTRAKSTVICMFVQPEYEISYIDQFTCNIVYPLNMFISTQKHILWVLIRSALRRRF